MCFPTVVTGQFLQRLRGVELERALSESRNQQRCAEAHKPSSSDKTLHSAAATERLDEDSNGVGEVATETVERLTRLNRFLRQQNRELEGRWASDKNGGCNDLLTLDDNDSRAVDEAREVLGYTYPSLQPSARHARYLAYIYTLAYIRRPFLKRAQLPFDEFAWQACVAQDATAVADVLARGAITI